MKQTLLSLIIAGFFMITSGQERTGGYRNIDSLLLRGEYQQVVDTCLILLHTDSLDHHLYYKMALAYQNLTMDEKAFDCFIRASEIDTANNLYRFNVAKGYYSRGRNSKARPLLEDLYQSDTLYWPYSFYLTNILVQDKNYDKVIDICNRFYRKDSNNVVVLDKLGYSHLRKERYEEAIGFYERSITLNPDNLNAVRNLSFLYPNVGLTDTALYLLSKAIQKEPDDIDLRARRATIYFSRDHTKRAMDDYLKILSLGDSSVLYLKRTGIGYMYNLQAADAIKYLRLAEAKDTSDFEIVDFIARSYHNLKDYRNSALYYNKLIRKLLPFKYQLGSIYHSHGLELQAYNKIAGAIASFENSYELTGNPGLLINIANLYDEKLNNAPRAMEYYKKFLSDPRVKKMHYTPIYLQTVKDRLEFLKKKELEMKQPVTGQKP